MRIKPYPTPQNQPQRQNSEFPCSSGLIIVRSAGGRDQGNVFNQVRALIVEANGDARLLALSHTRGSNVQSRMRRYTSMREVAA